MSVLWDGPLLEEIAKKSRQPIYFEQALSNGTVFSNHNYEISGTLYQGQGGFVYQAFNQITGLSVVIKEFFPQVPINEGGYTFSLKRRKGSQFIELNQYSPEAYTIFNEVKERFMREANTLRKLNGKSWIIPLVDLFEANGTIYLVLEYMPYPTLAEWVSYFDCQESGQKVAIAKEYFETIASDLATCIEALHQEGFLHRDIKPANLFVTPKGIVLSDFGIARDYQPDGFEGTLMYTAQYAAPEQMIIGGKQGTWTDWYAYGQVLRCLKSLVGNLGTFETGYFSERLLEKLGEVDIGQRPQSLKQIEAYIFNRPSRHSVLRGLRAYISVILIIIVVSTFFAFTLKQNSTARRESTIPTLITSSPNSATKGEMISSVVTSQTPIETTTQSETTTQHLTQATSLTQQHKELVTKTQTQTQSETQVTEATSGESGLPTHFEDWLVQLKPIQEDAYAHGGQVIVEWDVHPSIKPHGIILSIMDLTTWQNQLRRMPLYSPSIDLSTLGLAPGKYRLYAQVNMPPTEIRPSSNVDIIIEAPSDQDLDLNSDQVIHSFKLSSPYTYRWSSEASEVSYNISIAKLNEAYTPIKVLETKEEEIDLSAYIQAVGDYRIVVVGYNGLGYSKPLVQNFKVYDEMVLEPVRIKVKHHQFFALNHERKISWDPVEGVGSYFISFYHDAYSETILEDHSLGDLNEFDFSDLQLKRGTHRLVVYYKDAQGLSSMPSEVLIEVQGP